MVETIKARRKSSVLAPSSIACLSKIPTVNLTAGCAHGCVYCYSRGYSSYPGEGGVMALPGRERAKILERVVEAGREHGVAVKVCACKNPDLAPESCSIAGDWTGPAEAPGQLGLFESRGQ